MFDGRMAVCLGVCKVDMRTVLFRELVKLLYGDWATPGRVISRWEAHVVVMGNDRRAISRDECLLVRFRPLDKDK